jgi:lysophospholipase L1-like esterase
LDYSPETFFGNRFTSQKLQRNYPKGIFTSVTAMEMLEANPPVYFERNLRNIAVIAKSHGVATVLSSFAYSPLFKKEPRVSSDEYRHAYGEGNEVVRRVSDETGAHHFDFAAVFPVDKDLYTDGRHVNEKGARLKAKLFADYLVRERLVPPFVSDG